MQLRDQPCHCGWKFDGFHICVDLSKPCEGEQIAKNLSGRMKLSERWNQIREMNSERNAEIVEQYRRGASYQAIADEHDVSKQTAIRIVRQAADDGVVVLRARGVRGTRYILREG